MATDKKKRIKYSVKDFYAAFVKSETDDAIEYDTPISIPGLKTISVDPAGEDIEENADGITWYTGQTNNGYTGNLEFEDTASLTEFTSKAFGRTTDANGLVVENALDEPLYFAGMFEHELRNGTAVGRRSCLYYMHLNRGSDTGDQKTVTTNTIPFVAIPRPTDNAVKCSAESTDTAYASFFTKVPEATTVSSGE